jgi:hypothetical protein
MHESCAVDIPEADRHRFGVNPDLDLTYYFDADSYPDPDLILKLRQQLTDVKSQLGCSTAF